MPSCRDAGHEALVRAVADGNAEEAAAVLPAELEETLMLAAIGGPVFRELGRAATAPPTTWPRASPTAPCAR